MPYMRRVADEVARREREAVSVARGGEVDLGGPRVQEILWLLQEGELDLRELGFRTELEPEVLRRFVWAMRLEGLVKVTKEDGRARTFVEALSPAPGKLAGDGASGGLRAG